MLRAQAAITPDGRRALAAAKSYLSLWNLEDGSLLGVGAVPWDGLANGEVMFLELSPEKQKSPVTNR